MQTLSFVPKICIDAGHVSENTHFAEMLQDQLHNYCSLFNCTFGKFGTCHAWNNFSVDQV